jgi:hypothetical protein
MAGTHVGVRHCPSMSDLAKYHALGMVEVRHISRISPGDDVEALREGTVCHSGRVTEVLPEMGLFWIFDEKSQLRKLIELAEFTVFVHGNPECDLSTPEEQF